MPAEQDTNSYTATYESDSHAVSAEVDRSDSGTVASAVIF